MATKLLPLDDRWSVEYDPDDNDRPLNLFRHGELHSAWTEANAYTAMFYALLAVREEEPEPERDPDDLRDQLDAYSPFVGAKLRHIKSNGFYEVVSFQFRESDMAPEFTYKTLHKEPILFSRPVSELFDGRFSVRRAGGE